MLSWINTKQLATHTIYGTSLTKPFRCKERSSQYLEHLSYFYEIQHDEMHYKTISIAFYNYYYQGKKSAIRRLYTTTASNLVHHSSKNAQTNRWEWLLRLLHFWVSLSKQCISLIYKRDPSICCMCSTQQAGRHV